MLLSPPFFVSEPSGAPLSFVSPPPEGAFDSREPALDSAGRSPEPEFERASPPPDPGLDESASPVVAAAPDAPERGPAPAGPPPPAAVEEVELDEDPQPKDAIARQATTLRSASDFTAQPFGVQLRTTLPAILKPPLKVRAPRTKKWPEGQVP